MNYALIIVGFLLLHQLISKVFLSANKLGLLGEHSLFNINEQSLINIFNIINKRMLKLLVKIHLKYMKYGHNECSIKIISNIFIFECF